MPSRQLKADIAVIGGGVGGCAAALAALEAGCTVILSEETQWIGGQLTSQLVPPDEHGWIEEFGRTATYHQFRQRVRSYYRDHYPLLPELRDNPRLNPGNGWVSPLCHEPRVALAVLTDMLARYRSSGQLLVLTEHRLREVTLAGRDEISAATLENTRTDTRCEISARYFLDATEVGDVLAQAGVEHVTGQESQAQTGEPSAPKVARPENVQAFSWCFAIEHRAGENHVGPSPEGYSFWKNYQPPLTPPWPAPLLSWAGLNPRTMAPVKYRFSPHEERPQAMTGLWTYRRILDRAQFQAGAFASDRVAVNWPMIDYLPKSILADDTATRVQAAQGAKQLSLAVFYWLQTEAPRADGGIGWPGLRLRGDVAGTEDGLAMAPYIRESRRIRAETTICEQDVSGNLRPHDKLGECYEDSVGVGCYRIDLHPTCGGDNYLDVPSLPFRIPLGALIPVRMENLLPAAKNLGTTHITNGCYRLHPVEWNVGESAGALAAFCVEHGCRPRDVLRKKDRLTEFQDRLVSRGVELRWPDNLNLEKGDPHAHMRPA